MTPRVRCLSIGSSDSGGGAGVQGDVKAVTALGGHCATAVVGITAQDTRGVRAAHGVPAEVIGAQIDAVVADIGVDVVKVGATWSPEVIEVVVERIGGLAVPKVVDPVLGTASGSDLADRREILGHVRRLLVPSATVLTPNLGEAQVIAGLPRETDPAVLAEALVRMGAAAVIVTDMPGPLTGDWLFDGDRHEVIAGPRHSTGCEHGAGCAHSAILAVLLVRGLPLVEAAHRAREIVAAAVRDGAGDIGGGVHPVDVPAGLRALGGRAA